MAAPVRKNDEDPVLARRKRRSIALGLVLALLVAILYALTVVKLGPDVLQRPI